MEGDIKVSQMVQKSEIDEKCCKWFKTWYSTKGYNLLLHMVRISENDQLMLHMVWNLMGDKIMLHMV